MPKLKPSELINLEFVEPGIIQHLPARCTLAKQIAHQREKEEIFDSGFVDFYRDDFLNDDHRNSVMPAKAIWPWPVPTDFEFNNYFTEEDYQEAFPLSSVRPKSFRFEKQLDLTVMADEAEFSRRQHDRLLEEFQIMDRAEAYGERLRNMGL